MRRMFSLEQLKGIADSEIKSLVEGGTLNNAKPLYFHPLSIIHASGQPAEFMCSVIVINNSPEPINTWTKLTNFFDQVYESLPAGISYARFPCTGFIKGSGKIIVSSVIEISGKTDSTRIFTGMNITDNTLDRITASDVTGAPRVEDGVNKIN